MSKPGVTVALVLAGCSGGASARLEMSNDTAVARRAALLPDGRSLRLKIIAAYLTADIDPVTMNNVGNTEMIWLNPECNDDISGCNIAGFEMPTSGPRVQSYFDLARPSADVTADLNSQDMSIEAGTYRFARVEFCKSYEGERVPTVPTMMWSGPGMTTEQAFLSGDCTRNSVAFDPPLTLAEGDAVSVSLGYDLDRTLVSGTPMQGAGYSIDGENDDDGRPHIFRACYDVDADTRDCMDFPEFQPTATKL